MKKFILFILVLFSFAFHGFSQSVFLVKGKVTNEKNEGFSGVNITQKNNPKVGVISGVDGEYSIQVSSENSILIFTFLGYKSEEISVNGKSNINVQLSEGATILNQVVVVGYGTQKKVSLTGAVGEIRGTDLVRRPVNSLEQALQGQLPGLTIQDNGGGPGKSVANIRVRGVTTIGNNNPLVIVDGIEQRYSDINPNDIESISVLKDASSTAIYGSRAANGVLLITTKRAKLGQVAITYNGSYGFQKSINQPEVIELNEFFKMQKLAFTNVGSAPRFSDQQVEEYLAGVITDPLKYPALSNWFNTVLSVAPQQNHAVSISGGNENLRGRLSIRHQDQDGIIAHSRAKISEIRVNTDFKVSSKISLSADLYFQHKNYSSPVDEPTAFLHFMHGTLFTVPKYPDGTYGLSPQNNNALLSTELLGKSTMVDDIFSGTVKGDFTIMKGLVFTSQFAVRIMNDSRKDFRNSFEIRDYYNPTVIKKTNPLNRLDEFRTDIREYTLNNLLNYSTSIKEHEIKVLLGYSEIKNSGNTLTAYRQGFYNNQVQSIGQGTNDNSRNNGGGEYIWGLRSYFGRVNYSFKDKYLLEVNSRYDGSSRFLEGKRYSFFPSVSSGWRLSQEKFWEPMQNVINEFKIRGSWGKTGNQAVALYSYFPTLNVVNYTFSGTPAQGFVQQQLANQDITWETTTQFDVGFDLKFLNNRFNLSIDYYKKKTEGILLLLPVPATLGLNPSPQNAGRVDNKGIEIALGSRNKLGAVSLEINSYFAINNNKVVDLAGTGPYIVGTGKNPKFITGVGYPISAFWGYKTGGLFQTQEEINNYPTYAPNTKPGDVKYLDLNNDGKITPDDETYLGNTFPKYTFGSTINIGYKGLSLNILLQGAADVHTRPIGAFVEMGNFEGVVHKIYTNNYWTPENPNARFPRPTKFDLRNQQNIDTWVLDASYLRFKNIQLMYQIPDKITNKLHVSKVNVYVSGTNLITFSKLNEWNVDPELVTGYADYYPQGSLFTFGVNVQF
jgi:TonB-linked SusC/RagA family outer membrane protein